MDGGKVHWSYWEQRPGYFSGSTPQLSTIVLRMRRALVPLNRPGSHSSIQRRYDGGDEWDARVKDDDTLSAAASDQVADWLAILNQ